MYPVPIGSGLGEIRGLTFFCAGSDANMAEYRAYIMDKDGLISRAIGLVCPDDETAMEYAKQFVEGHDVELWQHDCRIATFKHKA